MAPPSWSNGARVLFEGTNAVDDSSNQVRMMVVQDATAQTGTKDHAALNFYYENAGSVLEAGSTPLFRIQQGTTDNTTGAITTAKKVQFDGQTIAEDQSGTATIVADCAPASLTVADTPVALTGTATLTHDGTTVINSSGKIPAARLAEHDGSALDLTGIDFTAADITCGNLTASGTITRVNEVNTDVTDRAPRFGTGSEGAALSTNDSKDRALVLETYTDSTQNAALVLPTKASGTIDEVEIRANVDPTLNSVGGDLAKIKASNFVDSAGSAILDGSNKIPFSRLENEPALLNGASGENFAMAAGSAASLSATGEIDAATFDASSGYKVGASTVIDSSSNFSGGTIDGSTITASTHVETPSIGNTGSTLSTVSSIVPSGTRSVGTYSKPFLSMYASTMYTTGIHPRTGDTVTVNGHLVPLTDDNNSLGTASKQFSEAHVAGAVDAGSYTVGGVSAIDASRNFSGAAGTFSSVATGSLANGGSALSVGDALVPDVSATRDLGSATYKWANIHASGAADVGSLEVGGTEVIDSSRNIVNVPSVTSLGYVSAASVIGSMNVKTTNLQGYFNSDVSLGNNLVPATDGGVDIGSSSKKVGTVYADSAVTAALANEGSSISLGDSLVPDADGTLDVGSSDNKLANVYSDAVNCDTLNLSGGLSVSSLTASVGITTPALEGVGGKVDIEDDLIPSTDAGASLGSVVNRFADVHTDKLSLAGDIVNRGGFRTGLKYRNACKYAAADLTTDFCGQGASNKWIIVGKMSGTTTEVACDIVVVGRREWHELKWCGAHSSNVPCALTYVHGSGRFDNGMRFRVLSSSTDDVDYLALQFVDGTYPNDQDVYVYIDDVFQNFTFASAPGDASSGFLAASNSIVDATPRAFSNATYSDTFDINTSGTLTTGSADRYDVQVDSLKVLDNLNGALVPRTGDVMDLGSSSKRMNDIYAGSLDCSGNVIVGQERGSGVVRQRMIIPWSAVDTLRDSGGYILLARAMRTRPDEDVTADATYSTSSCSGKIKLHTQRLYHEFLLDADASGQTPGRLEYIGGSHNSFAPVTLKFVCCKDDTTEVTQKDFDDYLLLKFQASGTWGDNDDTDLIIDFDTPNCLWKCADGNEVSGYKALGSIVTITTPREADHTSYDEAITVSSAGAVTLATDTLLNYETEVDTTKVIEQNEAVYRPRTDNTVSLGSSSKRFANVYTTSLYSSNDLVVTSDARKKRAIEEIEEVDYRPLKARRFEMIEQPGRQRAGFIAQEVQAIMPEAVTENDGVLGIDPVAISGHMWNRVDRLEAKLDALIDSLQQ